MSGLFVKRARDWMAGHGYRMPWTWVQERGARLGAHCHILLHVPADLDLLFRPMPLRWVKALLPGCYVSGVLESQRLGSAYFADFNPALYDAILMGKVHYMLKCAPAKLEEEFDLIGRGPKPWGQSCLVIGKRAAAYQRQGVDQPRGRRVCTAVREAK